MARSRHCDICNGWHDTEEPWPPNCLGHFHKRRGESKSGIQIIKDIEPYKAIGLPGAPVITSRKHHRDALRAHGLIEVGNEKIKQQYQAPPPPSDDIKRAMDRLGYKGN